MALINLDTWCYVCIGIILVILGIIAVLSFLYHLLSGSYNSEISSLGNSYYKTKRENERREQERISNAMKACAECGDPIIGNPWMCTNFTGYAGKYKCSELHNTYYCSQRCVRAHYRNSH